MELNFERVKKYENWIVLATCLLVVFVMYGRTIFGDFVFDDRGIIDHQAMLGDPNQLHRTLTLPYWTEETGLYRPITLLSYAFNFFFLGSGAWGFHLVNSLLYALSGFLIYLLVLNLFLKKPLAYLAAILFLVLSIHTEAVANISGRSEILALGFSLLVFWEVLGEKIVWWRAGLFFALALGSKETAIAAVPLAVLVVYFKERNFSRELFLKYLYPTLAMFAGAILYFGARFLVLGQQYFLRGQTTLVENPLQFVAAKERIATALKVLAMYLQKTFWPVNLCSDYSYNQIPVLPSFFNWPTLFGAAAVIVLIAGVFIGWKKSPVISFGCAWFLLSFFLVSNFILPIGTIAGERLIYYPSLGICLIMAWGVVKIYSVIASDQRERGNPADGGGISGLLRRYAPRNDKLVSVVFVILLFCLIIFYGVISFRRAGDWLTEKKLFASAAQCAPKSVLSRSNLGAMYYLSGDLVGAKKALLEAQEIYPDYPKGVNNLGLVYRKEGDKQKAKELFLKALSYRFPYYGAYENLALMALEDKNWPEAKKWLLEFYLGNEQAAEAHLRALRGW